MRRFTVSYTPMIAKRLNRILSFIIILQFSRQVCNEILTFSQTVLNCISKVSFTEQRKYESKFVLGDTFCGNI